MEIILLIFKKKKKKNKNPISFTEYVPNGTLKDLIESERENPKQYYFRFSKAYNNIWNCISHFISTHSRYSS